MGIPYTREHAEVLDNVTKFMNELGMILDRKGLRSPSEMIPVAQELYWSDRGKMLRAQMSDVNVRSQNESQREKELCRNIARCINEQEYVSPENCGRHKSERNKDNCRESQCVRKQDADGHRRTLQGFESTTRQSAIRARSENSAQFPERPIFKQVPKGRGVDLKKDTKPNQELESNAEQQPLTHSAELTSHDPPGNRGPCSNKPGREFEKRVQNRYFDHLFGTVTDAKKDPLNETKLKNGESMQPPKREGGFDFVPSFRSQGWPKVTREWIKRERKWPSPDIVDRVSQEGFHLVVKPPKNGGNPDCDFRISFSHAEYLLSQEMNDIQRECHRCLKKYHRAYLSTEPKGLVTFHLKNIFLHAIEETGAEMWTESNRAKCMMKLLKNLSEALTKKDLPHYFVRTYNLFGVDYIECLEILESLAEIVEQIIQNPMRFATVLVQTQDSEGTAAGKEDGCILNSEQTLSTDTKGQRNESDESEDAPSQDRDHIQRESQGESPYQGGSSFSSHRYYDLKDTFLAMSKELTDMAFNERKTNCRHEALDPLVGSLVEGIREIERLGIIRVEEFPRMFDICWDTAYYRVLLSNEQDMRRRVLHGIQSAVEMCRYVLKQDDFATGNEEALIRRMLDPTGESPFDLNHIIPEGSGTQFILRLFNSPEPNLVQSQETDIDDIPLD